MGLVPTTTSALQWVPAVTAQSQAASGAVASQSAVAQALTAALSLQVAQAPAAATLRLPAVSLPAAAASLRAPPKTVAAAATQEPPSRAESGAAAAGAKPSRPQSYQRWGPPTGGRALPWPAHHCPGRAAQPARHAAGVPLVAHPGQQVRGGAGTTRNAGRPDGSTDTCHQGAVPGRLQHHSQLQCGDASRQAIEPPHPGHGERGQPITNGAMRAFPNMAELRSLSLRHCRLISASGLRSLSSLNHLNRLSLCHGATFKGGAWWTVLALLTGLTSLNLFGCYKLDSAGMSNLVHLPLKALAVENVTGAAMYALVQLNSLTELHLATWEYPLHVPLSSFELCALSVLTGLHTLALRNCWQVPAESIKLLVTSLRQLQHLSLQQQEEFGDKELRELMGGTNGEPRHLVGLKSLDMRGTAVTGTFLGCLSELQGLTFLGFGTPYWPLVCQDHDSRRNPAGRPPKEELAKLTQLSALAATGMEAPGEVVEAVLQLPGLRSLSLDGAVTWDLAVHPFDVAACGLSKLTGVELLDLGRRGLELEQLSAVMACLPKLRNVYLLECMPESEVNVSTSVAPLAAAPLADEVPGGWCLPLNQLPLS